MELFISIIGLLSGIMAIMGIDGILKWKISKAIAKRLGTSATSPAYLLNRIILTRLGAAILLNACIALATYKFVNNALLYGIISYTILVILSIYLLRETISFQMYMPSFWKRFKFLFIINIVYHFCAACIGYYIIHILDPEFYKKNITAKLIAAGVPPDQLGPSYAQSIELTKPFFFFFSAGLISFFLSLILAMLTTLITTTERGPSLVDKAAKQFPAIKIQNESNFQQPVVMLETKIRFAAYIRLVFWVTYRKPIIILFTILGLGTALILMFYFAGKTNYSEPPSFHIAISISALLFFPILIYFKARSQYLSNASIRETTKYEFFEDKITVIGETFKTDIGWSTFYRIEELNSWILLYQNKLLFTPIPKRSFGAQLAAFRSLVSKKKFQAHRRQ